MIPANADLPHAIPAATGSIWVVAELAGDGVRQVTLEMLGKARALTPVTRSEVVAVVIGDAMADEPPPRVASHAPTGKRRRGPGILTLDTTGLGPCCADGAFRRAACPMPSPLDPPYAVLFAATADGRDLAARIAARQRLGLTGDAIDLEINEAGQLVQLKPALGGNVVAPILSKTLPNLVTLRPGVLTPGTPETGRNRRTVQMDTIAPAVADRGR